MKFSEQWLREWVNPAISTQQLADQLTMAGLEVDAVTSVAPEFEGVVVGEVLSVEPHPDADKLKICKVNIGKLISKSIVCGAENVVKGMKVPTARVGAKLPGGLNIEKTKIRGVGSRGMLCSAKELGLAEQAEGLMRLAADAKPGMDLHTYLKLDDVSIELGLTPNRGDCLSLAGIAREVGALNRCTVSVPPIMPINHAIDDVFNIEIKAKEACPRYVGRVIKGIDADAEVPLWLSERLRRSGLRSISPVVDVTNYILLELGQPMHAFDLDKLEGGICVRYANAGEELTLLDGQQLSLQKESLVIADQRNAIALAGIMGGLDSAVMGSTQTIFLESAFFSPNYIAGKARQYNLHTDSSHRFERGVDPELPRKAMERATELLLEIIGGKPGPIIEVTNESALPIRQGIKLRAERVQRLIGVEISATQITDTLTGLGMQITENGGSAWEVVPPSYRFDIELEADLIEEIARTYGYDRLPNGQLSAQIALPTAIHKSTQQRQIRQLLVDRGYQEAITYSFVDSRLQKLLDSKTQSICLSNPISAEMDVMRTSLWPGLIQAAIYNQNRQQGRVRLFEIGLNYIKQNTDIKEEKYISGLVFGSPFPEQWGLDAQDADFYDIKGDIEALLSTSGKQAKFSFLAAEHQALHPGQSACIQYENQRVGWVGSLHPSLIKKLEIEGNFLVFELKYKALEEGEIPRFSEIPRFPTIRRDLAILVNQDVSSGTILECVSDTAGKLLQNLQLFDVYQGKGVDSGRKSIALGLTLQDFSRTLTDQEIDALIQRVLKQLGNKFGATLRE